VSHRNTLYNLEHVEHLTRDEIQKVTPENWQKAIDHVIKIEHEYSKTIPREVEIIDPVVINFDSDSEDDFELQGSSDESYDSEF